MIYPVLESDIASFTGTDAYCLQQRCNENFAITNLTGNRSFLDAIQYLIGLFVFYRNIESGFWYKVDSIFGTTI